jgi:hypothetical protein
MLRAAGPRRGLSDDYDFLVFLLDLLASMRWEHTHLYPFSMALLHMVGRSGSVELPVHI